MGFNTAVVILNDAISSIESDPQFGRTLGDAMRRVFVQPAPIEVPAGNFCNAAYVLGSHHSSRLMPFLVGGNIGVRLDGVVLDTNPDGMEERLLHRLAEKNGYRLVKKRKKT